MVAFQGVARCRTLLEVLYSLWGWTATMYTAVAKADPASTTMAIGTLVFIGVPLLIVVLLVRRSKVQ
jgi:hypothetical protein